MRVPPNSLVLLPFLGSLSYYFMGSSGIKSAVVGYSLSFIPYLCLLWFMGKYPSIKLSKKLILFGVGIASIPLLMCEPILSEDIWRYVWDGFRVGSGQNPYCLAPNDSSLDPFANQYELADVRQKIGHAQLPTIYPPVAQFIFSATSMFSPSSLPLRLLGTVSLVLSTYLISSLLELNNGQKGHVALFAFNPLLLTEVCVSGHVDIFAVTFVIMALVLFRKSLPTLSALSLSAAILTKLIPVLIAPFVLRGKHRQWLLCIISIGGVYLLLDTSACSPFGSLSTFGAKWRHNDGVFGLLHWCYTSIFNQLDQKFLSTGLLGRWLTGDSHLSSPSQLGLFFAKLTSGLFVVGYLFDTMRRDWSLEIKVFSLFVVFFLVSPVVHPWYLLWTLPLIPLLWSQVGCYASLPLIWWSMTSLVAYDARISLLTTGVWKSAADLVWLEYGGLLVVFLFARFKSDSARIPNTH
ncbi:MAG: glycosyltransferase 87 family protein [Bradymonadia bacterium]